MISGLLLSASQVQKDTRRFDKYGDSFGRLHAKCAVIDQETIFAGSMNFGPRSDKYNSEMGLFIHSSELAAELMRLRISSRTIALIAYGSPQMEAAVSSGS